MTRAGLLVRRGSSVTPPPPARPLRSLAVLEPWKLRDLTTMANWDDLSKAATFDGGTYKTRGAFHRDVPLNGPLTGEYRTVDYQAEVANAQAAGLDGFLLDITNPKTGDANYERIKKLAQASVGRSFAAIPMLDINGGAFNGIPGTGTTGAMQPEAVATAMAALFAYGASLMDGAYWVNSFKAEGDGTQKIAGMAASVYWTRFLAELRMLVTDAPVKFCGGILHQTSAIFNTFAGFSDMLGIWGPANPSNVPGLATWATLAHSLGCEWMAPVRPTQDFRAYSSVYAENQGSKLGRDMWARAMADNAMHALIITWNDFAESTQICPTRNHGTAASWLTSYYAEWFRTGVQPTITEDRVILIHRRHSTGATPTTAGLTPITCTLDGGGVHPYDFTEALVFAKAAGTTVAVNNNAPVAVTGPGVTVVKVPLWLDHQQTAVLTRGGVDRVTVHSAVTPHDPPVRGDYDNLMSMASAA